jgi:hypothetical protein
VEVGKAKSRFLPIWILKAIFSKVGLRISASDHQSTNGIGPDELFFPSEIATRIKERRE